MESIIQAQGVGKSYRLSRQEASGSYLTLRESLVSGLKDTARRLVRAGERQQKQDFWAVQDVSFEVAQGEVIGIIGGNGAGKSTLLKLLSRITRPTTGRIVLRGRVGSLLEVGTGFHPELTGRENIFLNGTILGMSRREIIDRFDDIVEFSGVSSFLDLPVKRYSSGMFVRLAFSVAANLRPEIMIVDEVLAVGDASFQRRCIDRMAAMAREGTTLLFVSHNMDLIPRLCTRALWMKSGQIVANGEVSQIVNRYLTELNEGSINQDLKSKARLGNGRARFENMTFYDQQGQQISTIHSGEDFRAVISIRSEDDIENVALSMTLKTIQGTRLVTASSEESRDRIHFKKGTQTIECSFKSLKIRPGTQIAIELSMCTNQIIDHVDIASVVDVIEMKQTRYLSGEDKGLYTCDFQWSEVATVQ